MALWKAALDYGSSMDKEDEIKCHWTTCEKRVLKGLILIPSTEIIKNPKPNNANKEILNIDLFNNPDPNLLSIP